MSLKNPIKPSKTGQLRSSFLLSLLITANLCLFGPLQVVVSNIDLYLMDFSSLSAMLLKTGIITWFFLFLIIHICSRISSFSPILFLALAVGLWVQGNFFLWNYGTVYGKAFNFSMNFWNGVFEAVFWFLLFVVFIKYRHRLAAYTVHITIFLLVLQGADLGVKYRAELSSFRPMPVNLNKAVEFSKNQNAIIIILDSFQADDLEEAMRRADLGNEDFKGFVHFRNAVSQYSLTKFSIPSLFSTQRFPKERYEKIMDLSAERNWDRIAFDWSYRISQSSSMFLAARRGVSVDVIVRRPINYGRAFENLNYRTTATTKFLKEAGVAITSKDETENLLSISLFRHSPHFLKKYIYNNGDWIVSDEWWGRKRSNIHIYIHNDIRLLKQLTNRAVTSDVPRTFKIFHFWAPHTPHDADKNCEYNGMPTPTEEWPDLPKEFRKDSILGTSACILRHLAPFLQTLERLGVYDNSLILIIGDHGNKQSIMHIDTSKLTVREAATESSKDPSRISPSDMGEDFSMGVPLFMVKPPFAKGGLRLSDAPVSLCDVPATIFDYLGEKHSFNCMSVFKIPEDEKRVRFYYNPKDPPEILRFKVTGHSWYESSWSYDKGN